MVAIEEPKLNTENLTAQQLVHEVTRRSSVILAQQAAAVAAAISGPELIDTASARKAETKKTEAAPATVGADFEAITAKLKLAQKAQDEWLTRSQEDADRIFEAIARKANQARLPLAKLAYEETQMGCVEDKTLKNGLICELISDKYRDTKTCGLIESDDLHGKYVYANPAGPVCCITPVTNPTSTVIAKTLLCAKTRNAVIILPSRRAKECCSEAARICAKAGEEAGAPKGWIQIIDAPSTRENSKFVMESEYVKLIVATGGPGLVHASYQSGRPAIGVGSGNAPVLVDELADLQTACGSIVLGKCFDNGVICASEQSCVVVDEVYEPFKKLLQSRGVYFLPDRERSKLADFIHKDGRINPDIVGQSAVEIARRAGFESPVPVGTVVLATEEDVIGDENPLSGEKLSPVLSLFRVKHFEEGLAICKKLAEHGGEGHTAGLYTEQSGTLSPRAKAYVSTVPVGRVFVNSPTSLTAIGSAFNFNVDPSLTLGVGTHAGSSLSGNLTPMNLINTTTVAERQTHMEWFHLPKKVFVNRGCLEEALTECAKEDAFHCRDKRAMIVCGKVMVALGHAARVATSLKNNGFVVDVFSGVTPDPDMNCVRAGVRACELFKPDLMVALGGGSPLDAAKFIRVCYEHPEVTCAEAAVRFIEIRKRTNPFPKLGSKIHKLVAVPTTSGTGSEVSPFTIITDDDGMKQAITSYQLTPDIAICDSTFCDKLPKSLVANSGVDAIVHSVEAYVSVAQHSFTKEQALEALRLMFQNLPESYQKGTPNSRDAVHRGAMMAGMAFSNSFLGIAHSLGHKVGAQFHLPHGMTVFLLLPHVIRYNASNTPTRMGVYPSYKYPQSEARYCEIAKAIGAQEESVEGLVQACYKIMDELELPKSFEEAGVDREEFITNLSTLAEEAFDDQCTLANPRFPLISELKDVLMAAYEGEPVSDDEE